MDLAEFFTVEPNRCDRVVFEIEVSGGGLPSPFRIGSLNNGNVRRIISEGYRSSAVGEHYFVRFVIDPKNVGQIGVDSVDVLQDQGARQVGYVTLASNAQVLQMAKAGVNSVFQKEIRPTLKRNTVKTIFLNKVS